MNTKNASTPLDPRKAVFTFELYFDLEENYEPEDFSFPVGYKFPQDPAPEVSELPDSDKALKRLSRMFNQKLKFIGHTSVNSDEKYMFSVSSYKDVQKVKAALKRNRGKGWGGISDMVDTGDELYEAGSFKFYPQGIQGRVYYGDTHTGADAKLDQWLAENDPKRKAAAVSKYNQDILNHYGIQNTEKTAGRGGLDDLEKILGAKAWRRVILTRRNLHGANPLMTNAANTLSDCIGALAKRVEMDPKTAQALELMRWLNDSGKAAQNMAYILDLAKTLGVRASFTPQDVKEQLGKSASGRTAAENGPITKVLLDQWNNVHDIETEIEFSLREWDQAASYSGAKGERDAKKILDETKKTLKYLKGVSREFEKILKLERAFIAKHGHPSKYIRETQYAFGFRG